MGGFRDDPDYVTVLALEIYDDDTDTATKAPIFRQRVNRRAQRPQRARDAADAVALCLDERGQLDPTTIARLLDVGTAEVPAALGDLAYHDPEAHAWVTADDYLSGDVRYKLDAARAAATTDPARYMRNVAALEAVQPADLGPGEIRVKLGAPWVEAADIQAFLVELLGGQVTVRHEPLTATWEVKIGGWQASSSAATAEWGTSRISAYELVQLACNGGAPVVYDEVERPNGSTTRVRNISETMLAEAKLQALNDRFREWLWEDPDRTDRLVEVYNRRYNATVLRRFNGSHLTFPGLADWFQPYGSQRDIAYRIAATPAALCGFAVGSGKTAAMLLSALTLRRLGLAAKPLIACPNHLLEQIARDGKRLFPNANILMVAKDDLTRERRKRFAARCATGDWDVVVLTHSAFTALAVHPDTEAAWLATQIERYRQAAMALGEDEHRPSRTVKQIAKQADRLEARQRELLAHRTDDGVTFEQLGVDYLLVDECFPYGTPVLTDRGVLPIGAIVESGLPVTVASVNQTTGRVEWKPVTRWVRKPQRQPLLRVRHQHGAFMCTPNHRIWVEGSGYVRADAIRPGAVLRVVPPALRRQASGPAVLQPAMCRPVAGDAAQGDPGDADLPVVRHDVPAKQQQGPTVLRQCLRGQLADGPAGTRSAERTALEGRSGGRAWAAPTRRQPPDARPQSDARRGDGDQDGVFPAGANLVVTAWRPGTPDGAATSLGGAAGAAYGVHYSDPASGASVRVAPALVRGRPGMPIGKAGDRGRRQDPQDQAVALPGSPQDGGLGRARVVDVEVLEPGGADGHRSGRGGNPFVYNLEVADNHNYFADGVLVSNCHYFKRLGFPTRMEGFSVEASKRATDLALKLWWLRGRNPAGRCGAFFTGTPISNSLAELYVLLTYLMPGRLAELRIDSFDAFAGMFIEFKTQIEVAPDGRSFRLHRRPANFTNVPELRTLLGEVADIRTRDTLGLATPDAEFDTVVVPASPELRAFVATLVERADAIRAGGVDRHDDNMLAVCNDGRRAALDLELVGIASQDPGKVGAVVERVAAIWRETADNRYPGKDGDPSPVPGALQVVFCDLGTPNRSAGPQVYGKLRRGLIGAGIPADRVRWVHEARTDAAKAALFADCRAGRVSVLLGSTDKLGVGTNIQDRCVAIHHVDAPWRPADVEQREGRALRPGNHNRRVRIIRYVTEGNFDSYMWQTLERKARFIAQILTGELSAREVEDVDTTALSYAEVKALATGQPLLLEAATVVAEVARLRNLQTGHIRAQRRIRQDIDKLLGDADRSEERAGALEAIADHAAGRDPVLTSYGGRPLADRGAIAKALAAAAAAALQQGSRQHLGQWCGLSVEVAPIQAWAASSLEVTVRVAYRHAASFEFPKGWLQQGQQWRILAGLDQLVQTAPTRAAELRAAAAAARARATDSQALLGRPFEHTDQLAAALARQQQLEAAMHEQVTAETPEPAAQST